MDKMIGEVDEILAEMDEIIAGRAIGTSELDEKIDRFRKNLKGCGIE